MSKTSNLAALRDNTDRRFAIMMTALQDFMGAFQQERNELLNLVQIEEKVAAKPGPPAAPQEAKKKKKKVKKVDEAKA